MRVRMFTALLPLLLMFSVSAAHAQYVEIYRLDNITKDLPDQQVLTSLATHLGVSGDTLKQQKTEYKLSFGELYLVHQLAKVTKSDFKSLMAEARSTSKTWGIIAKEKRVDMGDVSKDARQLESLLKKSQRTAN